MTKIGFTGTQTGMTGDQVIKLINVIMNLGGTALHHGDCIGADEQAHVVGRALHMRITTHPPVKDDKRAFVLADQARDPLPYIERNHNIVDEVDVLIAAPKTREEQLRSGTWATVRYARKMGREVVILDP